jgi:hypothetical protein
MIFSCEMFNPDLPDHEAIRHLRVELTADECKTVEKIRKRDGDEQALLIGRAYALKRVFREILPEPEGWMHTEPPQLHQS